MPTSYPTTRPKKQSSSTQPTRPSKPCATHAPPTRRKAKTCHQGASGPPAKDNRRRHQAHLHHQHASVRPPPLPLQPHLTPQSHHDHAGGNGDILSAYPLPLIGGKDCAHVTRTPAHNSTFTLGSITVTALHTPCHTQDSICYFFEDAAASQRAVFTGDTLFVGGCGRFFEGTPAQMDAALNTVLGALPADTTVWPGHEYTKGNVKFGASVLASEAMQRLQAYAAANKETQGKFTIGDEKAHNVFMRLDDPVVQKATGETERVKVMGRLREMKNAA